MEKTNKVFIAQSLDGYIADKEDSLDWLHSIPNPDNVDMGFQKFIESVDAIVMGRKTFEVVDSFEIEWPYPVPVFIISTTLEKLPEKYAGKAQILNGSVAEVLEQIYQRSVRNTPVLD